ncbi:MAG: DUF3343 domain-containing protein [Nitrospinae bacterium]|nr:DUF3343 domain-containing protein [Nitrospinota bacterium]
MEGTTLAKRVAVFPTTHQTLQAEKLLKGNGIKVRPVLKPRRIATECGMALEFDAAEEETIVRLCQERKLALVGIYPVEGS